MVTLEEVLHLLELKAELGLFNKMSWDEFIDPAEKVEEISKDLEKN